MGCCLSRLLKKLSQKEHWEIELEKKERGFSLYLNGANTAQRRVKKPRHTRAEPVKTNPTLELDMIKNKRPSRTAGIYDPQMILMIISYYCTVLPYRYILITYCRLVPLSIYSIHTCTCIYLNHRGIVSMPQHML